MLCYSETLMVPEWGYRPEFTKLIHGSSLWLHVTISSVFCKSVFLSSNPFLTCGVHHAKKCIVIHCIYIVSGTGHWHCRWSPRILTMRRNLEYLLCWYSVYACFTWSLVSRGRCIPRHTTTSYLNWERLYSVPCKAVNLEQLWACITFSVCVALDWNSWRSVQILGYGIWTVPIQ